MNDQIFKEYKQIKDQMAILEARKLECETAIFDEFDERGVNGYGFDGFQFLRMGRKTYEYSPAIAALTAEVAKKKKIEELDGTATLKKDSQHIRMVPIKEDA